MYQGLIHVFQGGMMSRSRGSEYEQFAETFLKNQGMQFICKNFLALKGEIDLIFVDRQTLVFVEVKYRNHSRYGFAAEMVSFKKQQLIIRTAEIFLKQNPVYQNLPCRFDVIAINGNNDNLDWIKNAFLIT